MTIGQSHWDAYAARFRLVGRPLRPGPEDTEHARDAIRRHLPVELAQRGALLLGVTAELAEVAWEPPVQLLAVDKSEGMIGGIWPGDAPHRRAQLGDWLTLQPPSGGFGLALGDGVMTLFEYPSGYAALGAALGRLLAPGGLLWLRAFCRLQATESVDEVMRALWGGSIGNFHVFKWRLAMALQGDATRGVRLADIWSELVARTSVAELARRTGFPEAEVATIDGYRDVQDRYSFSTAEEIVRALAPHFELIERWQPSYELGERCPHLLFCRRS